MPECLLRQCGHSNPCLLPRLVQADMLTRLDWCVRLDLAAGGWWARPPARQMRLRRSLPACQAQAALWATPGPSRCCQAHRHCRNDLLVSVPPAEVKPCLDLLFQLPQGSQQQLAGQAAAAANPTAASAREVWALRMHRLCSYVQQQVRGLAGPAFAASVESALPALLHGSQRQRMGRCASTAATVRPCRASGPALAVPGTLTAKTAPS